MKLEEKSNQQPEYKSDELKKEIQKVAEPAVTYGKQRYDAIARLKRLQNHFTFFRFLLLDRKIFRIFYIRNNFQLKGEIVCQPPAKFIQTLLYERLIGLTDYD